MRPGPAGPPASRAPRVLLVDDDPLARRWVQAALEDRALHLVCCPDVVQARAELAAAPVALVICDLMLPGTPGMAWLAELAADPALRQGARLAAFSAGADAAVRARLHALGVQHVLHKPVPLAELLACVDEALACCDGSGAATAPGGPTATPATAADPVHQYFGGDEALFAEYRAACLARLPADVAAGDAAWAAGDLPALRRLGHGLANVLEMLGLPASAADARRLDEAARRSDAVAAAQAWQALGAALRALSVA